MSRPTPVPDTDTRDDADSDTSTDGGRHALRRVTARFDGFEVGWPPVPCDGCSARLDSRAVLVVSYVERSRRYTLDWRYCPACGPDREVADPGTAVLDASVAVERDREYDRPVLVVREATPAADVHHRAPHLLPDPAE